MNLTRFKFIRPFNYSPFTKRKFHSSSSILYANATSSTSSDYESELILKTPINKIRNIGIIAHIDAGKTTTTERLLYYSGLTSRIGDVDQGDTITDYLTQEKDRGITIQSAAVTLPWKDSKINVIDTPGHADFTFEVTRSLRVLDGAVTILDSVAGVEAQTEKVWKQAKDLNIPIIAYVNKMDRDGAGFGRTVKEIVGSLGTRAVLINVPFFVDCGSEGMIFKGVLDIIHQKLLIWKPSEDGKNVDVIDVSKEDCEYPEMHKELLKCRESVVETLGELDESVIDNFLETEDYLKVSPELLKKSIRKLTIENEITPILCGSSFKNIGVQPLMDAIVDYLPSPVDILPPEVIGGLLSQSKKKSKNKNKNKKETNKGTEVVSAESHIISSVIDPKLGCIINKNKNLTTALAFKVLNHPNRGLMVFVRIYSGKLQPNSSVLNSRTGEKIKIGKLLIMNGETPLEVKYLSAGNIGVITGTDEISTGDTIIGNSLSKNIHLSNTEANLKLLPIEIPPPVFSVSIEPTTVADKRKLDLSLKMLLVEDPSLKLSYDAEAGQSILSGMGELHLEITKDRLFNDMKVKAEVGDIKVTYKETITKDVGPISKKEVLLDGSKFGVTLSLRPFECDIEDMITYLHDEGKVFDDDDIHTLDLNTYVIFDKNSMPEMVRKELEGENWNLHVSYEKMIRSILSGATGALQVGGRLANLQLQNIILYINKWEIPDTREFNNVTPLIKITRQAINIGLDGLDDKDFTILEPVMKINTYVLENDVGNVSQDLMSLRNAKIISIENEKDVSNAKNEGEDKKDVYWFKKQMESTYVPFDATMQYFQENKGDNNMVISSEAPLREMIGYLNKLRSITKGRGVYDMEFKGMERANAERTRQILEN